MKARSPVEVTLVNKLIKGWLTTEEGEILDDDYKARIARMADTRREHAEWALQRALKIGRMKKMDLQVGDEVMIWSESRGDKLKERWCGPTQITWIGEKDAVRVKRLDNGQGKMLAGHKVKKYWRPMLIFSDTMVARDQLEQTGKRGTDEIDEDVDQRKRLRQ